MLQRAWACIARPLDSYAGGVLAALGGMSMISNSLQTDFCAALLLKVNLHIRRNSGTCAGREGRR